VLGLRRCDVDPETRTVSVTVTVPKAMDGTMVEGSENCFRTTHRVSFRRMCFLP
jgi:hypothetical protein